MNEIKEISPEAKRLLNKRKKKHLKIVMRRKKARHQVPMEEPISFDELSLADFEKYVDENQEMITQELLTDPSKMILFGTDNNKTILRDHCAVWLWDSSFKVCFSYILLYYF